jgi:hypothetical protein
MFSPLSLQKKARKPKYAHRTNMVHNRNFIMKVDLCLSLHNNTPSLLLVKKKLCTKKDEASSSLQTSSAKQRVTPHHNSHSPSHRPAEQYPDQDRAKFDLTLNDLCENQETAHDPHTDQNPQNSVHKKSLYPLSHYSIPLSGQGTHA